MYYRTEGGHRGASEMKVHGVLEYRRRIQREGYRMEKKRGKM